MLKSTVNKQKNIPRLVGVVEAAGSSPVTQISRENESFPVFCFVIKRNITINYVGEVKNL